MTEDRGSRVGGYKFPVNGVEIDFDHRVVTGREVLTLSNKVPASEYQLILVRNERTKLVSTDEEIDLQEDEGGEFRAFESDRSFSFTVNEVGEIWGREDMEVHEFFRIWPPRPGQHWVLERNDTPDTILTDGGLLSFGPAGVEHVVSRKDLHPDSVLVVVVTTAGVYPAEGAARYPASTPIATVLASAKAKLHIPAVPPDWVVSVNGIDLNPNQSFQQAHLSGKVTIEWGAREGGGGA